MWTRNFTVQPRPVKFLQSFQWTFVCWCNENLDILHLFQPMTSQLWFFTFDWIKLECGRQKLPSHCHTMVHWKVGISLNGLGFRRIKNTWTFGGKIGNSGHSAYFYGQVTNWQQQNLATKLVFSNCLVEKRFFTMFNRNWSKIKKKV